MSQPKPSKTKANVQAVLALVAVVILVTGLGLVLRGIFLKNQPTNNTRTVTGAELNTQLSENQPLTPGNVDTQVLGTSTNYWANSIQNPFTPTGTLVNLLSVETTVQSYTGELKSAIFTSKFNLPAGARILAYFAGDTLIFSLPASRLTASTLWVYQSGSETQLHTLPTGATYTSVFLDTSTKSLYFSYQQSSQSVISSIRPNGQEIKVYTLPGTATIELLNIDSTGQKLYYKASNQSANDCRALDLTAKTAAITRCLELRQNSSGQNLIITDEDLANNSPAKVLFSSYGSKDIQTLFTADFGTKILDADRNSEFVTVLISQPNITGITERYIVVVKIIDRLEVAKYDVTGFRIEEIKFNHEGKVLAINRANLSEQLLIENAGTLEFEPVTINECNFNNCHITFIE